jgi:general secretion pathway protein F
MVIVRSGFDADIWAKEMRSLLNAGMNVVEAVDTLLAATPSGHGREFHIALKRYIEQGYSLADATERMTQVPKLLSASIRAGQHTGSIVAALDEYIGYEARFTALRKKLLHASIYPSFILFAGMMVIGFLFTFVIPRFARIYGDLRGNTSFVTKILLYLGDLVGKHELVIIGTFFAIGMFLIHSWRRRFLWSVLQRVLLHFAFVRNMVHSLQQAQLFHALTMLQRGGYPLEQALAITSELDGVTYRTFLLDHARAELRDGASFSDALNSVGLTDIVSYRLLSVGERGGNFGNILHAVAERYADDFSERTERLSRVIEPVFLLIIALVVGGIVVALYLPIFDVAASFG